MVYISADGSVGGKRSFWSQISDFVSSIINLVSLFFATFTNPRALESHASTNRNRVSSNPYAQRSSGGGSGGTSTHVRPRGGNIRGVKDLGSTVNCPGAGG